MTNVVHLSLPTRATARAEKLSALTATFADTRRDDGDVFWLKENAELLNILDATGTRLDDCALEAYRPVHAGIARRMAFFPQYYRFFLSICLDLEDLGIGGDTGETLVRWAAEQGLSGAEMSDLQRAEARRLMARRGVDPLPGDSGLDDRLVAFIARPATFALPNKKAAYELTHTIFYLTEYGRRARDFGAGVARSLSNAGTLAFLDRNADLLAEICVAMRFAGLTPPAAWEGWIKSHTAGFHVAHGDAATPAQDDYHEFLVCNWACATAGGEVFERSLPRGAMSFHAAPHEAAPLRIMSRLLLDLDTARCADWGAMRAMLMPHLDAAACETLDQAEASCADFDMFFNDFARADLPIPAARIPA